AADPFFVISNQIESGFWTFLGLCFGIAALRKHSERRRCLLAALTLVVFGGSDLVEARTGAWWRPWWLLAWKVGCVAVLLGLLVSHVREKRRRQDAGEKRET